MLWIIKVDLFGYACCIDSCDVWCWKTYPFTAL